MKKKSKRGGKRKGAGRPSKEKSVVIRIPESKLEEVKSILDKPQETYRKPQFWLSHV